MGLCRMQSIFLRSLILKLAEINANELNICTQSMSGLIHNNAISHIFQPTIRTRIWCLCGHSHEETIHPITISLPIHETIEKSMENITAPTTLPGHICPACGKSGGVQKSDHFQRAPIVLLICLERSSFSPVGVVPIYTKIRYGMTLNLSPYFCDPPSDLIYQLQATTFYTGHANIRNHFTAQVLSADGIWRYCNDSNIQRLIEPKLYSRDAYLLFYSLKSPSS
ncbi:Ubiquitin carboxyl-terminal hydrolase 21 [Entomophthora muscae]|uniref:Ubiquitin carboxyl-terminal hydrolase 21 n=1 Tax=Entomophthora muscae TaxID=34485 RepID=A0ACC2RPY1_9FUNG|nr:Ubiquitin carboxyl-terminal hydrolase 21 [Entomophthora muscae]